MKPLTIRMSDETRSMLDELAMADGDLPIAREIARLIQDEYRNRFGGGLVADRLRFGGGLVAERNQSATGLVAEENPSPASLPAPDSPHTPLSSPPSPTPLTQGYIHGAEPEGSVSPRRTRRRASVLTDDQRSRFDLFWLGGTLSNGEVYLGYPKKEAVGAAEAEWLIFNPDDAENERWCQMVDQWRLSKKWRDGFILDPERWIKRKCWDPRNVPMADSAASPRASPPSRGVSLDQIDSLIDLAGAMS